LGFLFFGGWILGGISYGVFIVGAKIKLYCKILIWGFYFWRLILGGISYGVFIVGAKIKLYCKILIWGFYFWRLILGGISYGVFIVGADRNPASCTPPARSLKALSCTGSGQLL
jgi:hypothetical protein